MAQTPTTVSVFVDKTIIPEGSSAFIFIRASTAAAVNLKLINPQSAAVSPPPESVSLMQDKSALISVSAEDDQKRQTEDRTFSIMLSSDLAGTVFVPGETWSFTIPPNDLEVRLDSPMGPAQFMEDTTTLRLTFTTDRLQNGKTFAVSSPDTRIAVQDGLITTDQDSFDVVLGLTEGAKLEREEIIELEIGHLDAFSRLGAQIGAGKSHTCTIRGNNTVACWGGNAKGQRDLTNASHLGAFNDVSNREFSAVSVGNDHTCGILMDDGTVACWGDRASGKSSPTESPQKAEGTEKFLAVSAGNSHTCGIRIDNTVACWGLTENNRLDPTQSFQGGVTAATKFLAVSAGQAHSCGIRIDNTVACWGLTENNRLDPTQSFQGGVTAATKFLAVSAGRAHSCGIKTDGTMACWGSNNNNQLDAAGSPHGEVTAVTKFLAVSTDVIEADSTCAIRIDRTLACWGATGFGAISGSIYSLMGSTKEQGGPINADDEFLAVSTGNAHVCAIRITGAPACLAVSPVALAAKPSNIQKAHIASDTFYLHEKQQTNVPNAAVRLRIRVFLEGALR